MYVYIIQLYGQEEQTREPLGDVVYLFTNSQAFGPQNLFWTLIFMMNADQAKPLEPLSHRDEGDTGDNTLQAKPFFLAADFHFCAIVAIGVGPHQPSVITSLFRISTLKKRLRTTIFTSKCHRTSYHPHAKPIDAR